MNITEYTGDQAMVASWRRRDNLDAKEVQRDQERSTKSEVEVLHVLLRESTRTTHSNSPAYVSFLKDT